uniref:Activin_recp domain-containing protein n=3 Tax=Wuchereria bancrofti TaxID=6293 RepID=A0AAF5PP79_WUCBA
MRSCFLVLYHLKSLTIILLASHSIASAVRCFSSMQKSQAEECGPNGYCFSFNGTDLAVYIKTVRGCDDNFICDVMVNNITEEKKYPVGRQKSVYGYESYCATDVMIRPTQEDKEMIGTLCCCNKNWCNANYEHEPVNDLDRIFELDHGTVEDYNILKEIAKKYGIS